MTLPGDAEIGTLRDALGRHRRDQQLLDGREFDEAAHDANDAALDSLAALLQETREQVKDGLYYVKSAIDCLGYQPFTNDEDWAAFIEEHGNAAAYLMSAQSSLEGTERAALSPGSEVE